MQPKNLKIMIISNKGGVGKSTTSMQLVTPYLYEKNGKNPIQYYEFDDENNDCLSFGASTLSERHIVGVSNLILKEQLTDILSRNEMACLDIGGNKSTTMVLEALHDSGMIHFIDLAVMPLLDGEQDGINTALVYTMLKDMRRDLPFLFVLNRVKNKEYLKYQFENFFGDLRGIFHDQYAMKRYLFDDEVDNYTYMLDDDVIKYSRRFGLTIYEIANQQRDFISQLKVKKDDANVGQEIKILSFKNYINKSAQKYYEEVLKNAFSKIDTILGV